MDLIITIDKHDFAAKLSFLLALCPMAECAQVESAGVLRISLHASQENSEMGPDLEADNGDLQCLKRRWPKLKIITISFFVRVCVHCWDSQQT